MRHALAQGGAENYIKTVHKRGYIAAFLSPEAPAALREGADSVAASPITTQPWWHDRRDTWVMLGGLVMLAVIVSTAVIWRVRPVRGAFAEYVAQARKFAAKALVKDPDNGAAHWALAAILPDNPQNWRQMETNLGEIRSNDMDFPFVLSSMAWLSRQEGRLEEAVRLQRRVVALDPFSPGKTGALAWILATQDELTQTRRVLAQAINIRPSAQQLIDYRLQVSVLKRYTSDSRSRWPKCVCLARTSIICNCAVTKVTA